MTLPAAWWSWKPRPGGPEGSSTVWSPAVWDINLTDYVYEPWSNQHFKPLLDDRETSSITFQHRVRCVQERKSKSYKTLIIRDEYGSLPAKHFSLLDYHLHCHVTSNVFIQMSSFKCPHSTFLNSACLSTLNRNINQFIHVNTLILLSRIYEIHHKGSLPDSVYRLERVLETSQRQACH